MDEIRELLGRLAELTAEELSHLGDLIKAEFGAHEADDPTPDNVQALADIVEAAETVATERTRRADAAAEAQRQSEELRSRMQAVTASDEETPEEEAPPAGDGQTPETPETPEGEEVTPETPEGAPEAIAASGRPGSRVARMAARATGRPIVGSPEAGGPAGRTVLTAAAGLRGFFGNEEVTDRMELATAMSRQLTTMDRRAPGRREVIVASAYTEYPEDRRLTATADRNAELIAAVTSPAALTASGGICLPVNVDYAVPTWSVADRPVRDGLPAFQTDRGGLRFVQPPHISSLLPATSVWTEATDATPGGATKPVYVVACGTEELVYVDAVPTRLQFGNMQSRFAPEQIAANTDLAVDAASRVAELNLLSHIDAASTLVSTPALLGASRDLLTAVDRTLAAVRFRQRLPRTLMFTAIFPEWAKEIIRADIAMELAHDDSGTPVRAVPDALIEDWFTERGVNVIWTLDPRPALSTGPVQYAFQGWTPQASGVLDPFPAEVVWNLFPEGFMQFLDSGRLDLGVVRDATLDSTNDYETFVETFEGIAPRGIPGESFVLVSTTAPAGGSAATIATTP